MPASLTEEVHAQLDRLAGEARAIALAYSGGGDSHALLTLASGWARTRGRTLRAFVVDHGLRPESGEEARRAYTSARAVGVDADILRWTGDKPSSGIQSAARAARHQLLARACADAGLRYLLLGHTLDDQVETIWMRLQAGSAWRGAAGMREASASPFWPVGRDLVLLRPLLDIRRQSLRHYLDEAGQAWIEDPSNTDTRYTRIRARRRLNGLESAGLEIERIGRWSRQLRDIAHAEAGAAARLAVRTARLYGWGGVRLRHDAYTAAPPAVRRRLLDALGVSVSGAADLAPGLLEGLDAALIGKRRHTAGGILVENWRGGLWLLRDPGAITGRVDQPAAGPTLQDGAVDGRFAVTCNRPVSISSLGHDYSGLPARLLQNVPGIARSGLLAFREAGHILALAGLVRHSGIECRPLLAQRFVHRLFAGICPAWFDAEALCDPGSQDCGTDSQRAS